MAFQETNITALSDIPPLVKAFATSVGFTVGGTDAAPTIKRPDDGSAPSFKLTATSSGSGTSLIRYLKWSGPGDATTYQAALWNPRHWVSGAMQVLAPTKVMLFGSLTPQPWLAIVVAFGFGLYRHMYIGNMEKIGNYTGGVVMSGNAWTEALAGNGSVSYRDFRHAYMFSSWQNFWTADVAGGVLVTHADNPTAWRIFRRDNTYNGAYALPQTVAMGGFQDNFNDAYVARGKASFAGVNILVPINLYATRASNNVSPLGRPPGVRLINIKDLAPEADILVGSKNWRVIPEFQKSSSDTATYQSGWAVSETSYYVGLAYRKD